MPARFEIEITSFFATLPLPAFVKDKQGRILYVNARAEKLWNVKAKEILGKPLWQVLGLSERQVRANDLQVLHHNTAQVFAHLDSRAGSPLRTILEFPMMDSEGRRVLGAIMVQN